MEIGGQALAALALTGAAAAALWWLKTKGVARLRPRPHSSSRPIQPLDRLALSPHHSLHLVRVGGCVLLIGRSPAGLSLLASRPETAAGDAS